MKTRKHGNGLAHKDVVDFSKRLARLYFLETDDSLPAFERGFDCGWEAACMHFVHELCVALREYESGEYNS